MALARISFAAFAVALASSAPLSTAHAQSPAPKRLGAPTATHPAEFTRVQGVRELADGRAYIVDVHEFRVVRVDFRTGDVTPMGRTGRGPGEYTLPTGLISLPGDSAAVIDMSGQPTSVLLTRDGVSPAGLQVDGGAGARTAITQRSAADARGRIYFPQLIIRTVDGKPVATDTNAIVRIDRASGRRDTVGFVSSRARSPLIKEMPQREVLPGGVTISRPFRTPIPFMSVDQFAVAPDGRVAVVSVDPYRVTFFAPDGKRTEAPPIAFTPVRVDDAVKEAYRADAKAPKITITFTREGGSTPGLRAMPYTEPEEWPAALPPFLNEALTFAPDGLLWVKRAVAPGTPTTFDLIDRAGRLASRVELPAGRRLVGFGNGTVYLVRVDEDGLEFVERYALPSFS